MTAPVGADRERRVRPKPAVNGVAAGAAGAAASATVTAPSNIDPRFKALAS